MSFPGSDSAGAGILPGTVRGDGAAGHGIPGTGTAGIMAAGDGTIPGIGTAGDGIRRIITMIPGYIPTIGAQDSAVLPSEAAPPTGRQVAADTAGLAA